MTKDNLGSESWQSDQARIAALEAQCTLLTNTATALRHNYENERAARVAAEQERDQARAEIERLQIEIGELIEGMLEDQSH